MTMLLRLPIFLPLKHWRTPLLLALAAHLIAALGFTLSGLISFNLPEAPAEAAPISATLLDAPLNLARNNTGSASDIPDINARGKNAEQTALPNATEAKPSGKPEAAAAAAPELLPTEELAKIKPPEPPKQAAAASQAPATPSYQLPNKAQAKYEGTYQAMTVRGTSSWQLKGDDYSTELLLQAGGFEMKSSAKGNLGAGGAVLREAEEVDFRKRRVRMFSEPENKRVSISNKEGFQPYSDGNVDVLSLMVQFAALVQVEPKWLKAGTAQDFTVLRPGGVRKWRLQSQGLTTLQVGGRNVEVVHIKRIRLESEANDYERVLHFWLDPARRGMLVRLRYEDTKDQYSSIDITLTQFTEE